MQTVGQGMLLVVVCWILKQEYINVQWNKEQNDSQKTKIHLVRALVVPIFFYGVKIWSIEQSFLVISKKNQHQKMNICRPRPYHLTDLPKSERLTFSRNGSATGNWNKNNITWLLERTKSYAVTISGPYSCINVTISIQ